MSKQIEITTSTSKQANFLAVLQERIPALKTGNSNDELFVLTVTSLLDRALNSNNLQELRNHMVDGLSVANELFYSHIGTNILNILSNYHVVSARYIVETYPYVKVNKITILRYLEIAFKLHLVRKEYIDLQKFLQLFPDLSNVPRWLGKTWLYITNSATPADFMRIYTFYAEKTARAKERTLEFDLLASYVSTLFQIQHKYVCPYCSGPVVAESSLFFRCSQHGVILPKLVKLTEEQLNNKGYKTVKPDIEQIFSNVD